MNELEVFKNEQFGSVRTTTIDNEVYFVGKDVAESLGYKDTADAIKRHVEEEDKLTRCFTDSGQSREMYVINESGLYSLILGSKLPSAKEFKHWVTSEVIPSIRKTGGYHLPQTYKEALQALLVAEEEKERLTATIQIQDSVIKEMQPKVTYVDLILRTTNTMPITSIAQDYGMSAKKLNKILASLGVQRKVGGQWILYQKYIGNGYVGTKTYQISDNVAKSNTEWTQKGRLFLYEFLKNEGILPVIESQSE